jgi:adenine-specific DNA-methyltransferase
MNSQKEEKRVPVVAAEAMPQVQTTSGQVTLVREHVPPTSGDIVETQIAKLREVFPEVFVEGKIDFDRLRVTLGESAQTGPGRFHFSWSGKNDAVALLQTPSRGTLIPYPGESINFETTGNAFIDGDNLEVLKLLFKPYFGRVKLIYIDPPYNTGQDFVYPDNYADPLKTYLQLTGQIDSEGNLLTSNPETGGRYHSAWLSMMYPRLFLARQLLRDDGVMCVSADDHEMHHLRLLMNEVFGEENFIATCIWQKRYSRENRGIIGDVHDYLVFYAREKETLARVRGLLPMGEESEAVYKNPNNDPKGRWRGIPMTAQGHRPNQMYKVVTPTGAEHYPPAGRCWSMTEPEFLKLKEAGRIWFGVEGDAQPNVIRYLSEVEGLTPWTWWPHEEVGHTDEAKKEIHAILGKEDAFDTPKPVRLMTRVLEIGTKTEDGDIVLDFFAGSATLAQAVLEINQKDGGNRKFILVQLPEPTGTKQFATIAEIAKERIRRAAAQLKAKAEKELDLGGKKASQDLGFKVFKLAGPNIQQWTAEADRDPDAYAQELELFNDPLISDWKPENVIWEVALREGFSLNTNFTERDLGNGNKVFDVTDPDTGQTFIICLDGQIRADLSKHCELKAETLFICRDVALDDSAAANLALQCRLKTI